MIKFLALLFSCFALASSIKRRRIQFGRAVSQEDFDRFFKFVVVVAFRCTASYCHICTGSLVAPDKVLLAAHCFCVGRQKVPRDSKISVFVGSTQVGAGRKVTATLEKRLPFDCKSNDLGQKKFQINIDAAVLSLDEPINDVRLGRIECTQAAPEVTKATMIGFGDDEEEEHTVLRMGDVWTRPCDPDNRFPVIRDIYCVDSNEKYGTYPNEGDSGGPLLIIKSNSYVIIGVYHGRMVIENTKCTNFLFRHFDRDLVSAWANMTALCKWYNTPADKLEPVEEKGRGKNKGKNCVGEGCLG